MTWKYNQLMMKIAETRKNIVIFILNLGQNFNSNEKFYIKVLVVSNGNNNRKNNYIIFLMQCIIPEKNYKEKHISVLDRENELKRNRL